MTISERITKLKKRLIELENKKGCKSCDRDEEIYQIKQEIKRLKKLL